MGSCAAGAGRMAEADHGRSAERGGGGTRGGVGPRIDGASGGLSLWRLTNCCRGALTGVKCFSL